ncbi:hypothetical protein [Sphingobacterium sp. IITKGP-BTPF85]|uniref:hypothetical protein n=1 Tax=Sphingobacterium sp. IITKGP-BTPF85 TaxID=1338009 RepID=UPI00038A008D|nr:hypothetical protein [Sphingobacterium sp. IITKGP-BTPF85]KKX48917.1 hypothetical protein L950_0218430 [Sphingobacterium sp. IITKGP-BTPF85]
MGLKEREDVKEITAQCQIGNNTTIQLLKKLNFAEVNSKYSMLLRAFPTCGV